MKVVTLIPPAVEVEPPPIIISDMNISEVESCICPMSTEVKPAVRVVADWNQLASSLACSGSSPSVPGLVHSRMAKTAIPQASSPAVPASVSLECRLIFRHGRRSSSSCSTM